jgi:hypothetical protein
MKKLIFILLFSIIATTTFAQASAASARMFKDRRTWNYREFLISNRGGYVLDTAELYALIRLSKNLVGHADWEYQTSDIRSKFATLFPILGRTNSTIIQTAYLGFYSTNNYPTHRLNLTGSPTLSNNSITFNGTTQRGVLQYFRNWSNSFEDFSSQFLMDSILAISPTDTLAQTNMNLSIFMKDSSDRFRFGSTLPGTPIRNFRFLKANDSLFTSVLYDNSASGVLNFTQSNLSGAGLFSTDRNGLIHKSYINGVEVASFTNSSYNFSLPRETTRVFELMTTNNTGFVAGTVQYFDIMISSLTPTEHLNKYNAVREFVRRKTL